MYTNLSNLFDLETKELILIDDLDIFDPTVVTQSEVESKVGLKTEDSK